MVDRYTKVVLTVIALCLMYLCVTTTLSVGQAHAAGQPANDVVDVNLVQVGGASVYSQPVLVKAAN